MEFESFAEAFASEDNFVNFAQSFVASKRVSPFSQGILHLLPEQQQDFWQLLQNAVQNHQSYINYEDKSNESTVSIYFFLAFAISTWLSGNSPDTVPPPGLIDLLAELHDSLFELNEFPKLQDEIAGLCERWFLDKRISWERFLPQLIPTLIILSFESNPTRVFALRETLLLFDFEDESTQTLKDLLLRCFVSPMYLKSNKGRKFLSFCMCLSVDLLFSCHAEMNSFETSNPPCFGPIYFEAWQLLLQKVEEKEENDNTPIVLLDAFETRLVQELLKTAIFHRDDFVRKTTLKLLNAAFHENKKDKRVDCMLCRVYAPFIFSGLQAVNAEVRKNTATLLFHAFPIHDPFAPVSEVTELFDKQFVAIETLLMDTNSDCRVCAVEGVCRILGLFGETIPATKISRYVSIIVNDLAFDKTSPLVRQSVLDGISYMLDFPLCHGIVRSSLSTLKHHLHDRSLLVRKAYCRLLLKIETVQALTLTEVADLDQILVRLVLDQNKRHISLPLCTVLLPVFFPKTNSEDQLNRARLLAQENFKASQIFFRSLKFVSQEWNRIVKLVLMFGAFVDARRRELETGASDSDCNDVQVALACICALWEPIAKEIHAEKEYAAAKAKLEAMFAFESFLLPLWNMRRFDLLPLCALIGPGNAPLERKIIRKLHKAESHFDAEVTLLCNWGPDVFSRVLNEVLQSLTLYLSGEEHDEKMMAPLKALKILARLVQLHPNGFQQSFMEKTFELFLMAQHNVRIQKTTDVITEGLVLIEIQVGLSQQSVLSMRTGLRMILEHNDGENVVLSKELIQGILFLAADGVGLGMNDILEFCVNIVHQFQLTASPARLKEFGEELGLDRLVFQLKLALPENEKVNEIMLHLLMHSTVSDDFLMELFRKIPQHIFKGVVLFVFAQHNDSLHSRVQYLVESKPVQIFTAALKELENDPENPMLFTFLQNFACELTESIKHANRVINELRSFKTKIGGVLGDRVDSLICELEEK